jgi:hypothetical protein
MWLRILRKAQAGNAPAGQVGSGGDPAQLGRLTESLHEVELLEKSARGVGVGPLVGRDV